MQQFLSSILDALNPDQMQRRRAAPNPYGSQLASGPKSPLSTGQKFLRGIKSAGVGSLAGQNAIPAAQNFYRGGGGPGLGVMDDGGPVPESGPYNLEEGEFVVPRRTAAALLSPIGGATQRDRVPGSPALSELARNPGNLLLRPVSAAISQPPAYMAPPSDSYANRVGRLRSVMQGAATREAEPPNADRAAASTGSDQRTGSQPGYMAPSTAAAPASIRPIAPGPAASRYAQDLTQTGPTAEQKKAAGVPQTTGRKLLRGVEAAGISLLAGKDALPAALDFYNAPEKKAEDAFAAQTGQDKLAAGVERQQQEDTRQASLDELNRRNVESEIGEHNAAAERDHRPPAAQPKTHAVVIDDGQGNPVPAMQDENGQVIGPNGQPVQNPKMWEKPAARPTDPFEAFAYGSPAEKKAAQDFLTFEKKTGAQYEKPDEIEERYNLYRKDPEAYKAMFGDRAGAQDQTQAARMLTYFDKRRKEITGDWTLDEPTRAQQLAEIEQLEQPYLNNAAGGGQGEEDRVTVTSPSGQQGTIPRSQLPAAQKKGYALAQQ